MVYNANTVRYLDSNNNKSLIQFNDEYDNEGFLKKITFSFIGVGSSSGNSKDNIYDFHGGNKLKYESDVALFIQLLQGEEDTTKRLMYCEKNRIFEENQRKGKRIFWRRRRIADSETVKPILYLLYLRDCSFL